MLGGKVKKEKQAPTSPELDKLAQYLADSEEVEVDVKVLAWWKAKESKWPALAKMVKQYFAAPLPRPPAWSASSRPRARCTATCRSRPRTRRWSTRCSRPSTPIDR